MSFIEEFKMSGTFKEGLMPYLDRIAQGIAENHPNGTVTLVETEARLEQDRMTVNSIGDAVPKLIDLQRIVEYTITIRVSDRK